MKGEFNYKFLFLFAMLFALIFLIQSYGNEVKIYIKTMLELLWIQYILWAYIIATFIAHWALYSRKETNNNNFIYRQFGSLADMTFGIATYGIGGTTSLTLIKGVYLQFFFDNIYFFEFGNYDILSMFLLSIFLLFYCLFNTTLLLNKILFYSKTSVVKVK